MISSESKPGTSSSFEERPLEAEPLARIYASLARSEPEVQARRQAQLDAVRKQARQSTLPYAKTVIYL